LYVKPPVKKAVNYYRSVKWTLKFRGETDALKKSK